jgi:hypothetical protein
VNAVRSELSDAAANLSNPGERRITREDYGDWRVRLLGATALTLDVVGFLLSGNTGFRIFAVGATLTGLLGVVLGRVRGARLRRAPARIDPPSD